MDHVVYIDAKENEFEKLLNCDKRMIIRGATGRKLPYGRVNLGDRLYFIPNDGSGRVLAQAVVSSVFNSDKLSESESQRLIEEHQLDLQLTPAQFKRWAGKRYLVLIGLDEVSTLEPFTIDRRAYSNMDDWLSVGEIEQVRVAQS